MPQKKQLTLTLKTGALRKARLERHISQAELGRLVGYTGASVSDWEMGKIKMPRTVFADVLIALGDVEVSELLNVDTLGLLKDREILLEIDALLQRFEAGLEKLEALLLRGLNVAMVMDMAAGRLITPETNSPGPLTPDEEKGHAMRTIRKKISGDVRRLLEHRR
jgi:transcriptional regulator with XRE-family HTH domain